MRSEAQKKADAKYSSKMYCMISIKSKKELCLNCRIQDAANKHGMSKNAYLLYIIENALSQDGYGLDTMQRYQETLSQDNTITE